MPPTYGAAFLIKTNTLNLFRVLQLSIPYFFPLYPSGNIHYQYKYEEQGAKETKDADPAATIKLLHWPP